MEANTKTISISLVIGLMANLASSYLFYLRVFSLDLIVFIIITSVFIMVIIISQSRNYGIEQRLSIQEQEQKRLIEKFKIHEQLIDMKAEIKELQKRFKK